MERARETHCEAVIKLLGIKLTDRGKTAKTGTYGMGKPLGKELLAQEFIFVRSNVKLLPPFFPALKVHYQRDKLNLYL